MAAAFWDDNEKDKNVSFGSCMDRQIFPSYAPTSRFGAELCPIRGLKDVAPGSYENEEKTNMQYDVEHLITSNKGYSIGARTGPRIPKQLMQNTPAPCHYQPSEDETGKPLTITETKPNEKPFLVGADRFFTRKTDFVLGPGAYEHDNKLNQKVNWHQSFGGRPIDLPSAKQLSTITANTDKLVTTRDEKRYQKRLAYLKIYYD